jgi:hypothetical protein
MSLVASPGPIPKTQLFRSREVILRLVEPTNVAATPTTGKKIKNFKDKFLGNAFIKRFVPNAPDNPNDIRLTEVLSVKQTFEGRAGMSQGVVDVVLQQWYLSPIRVEIAGRSYIGSYNDPSFNRPLVDDDVEKLLELRKKINSSFFQGAQISDVQIELEYGKVSPLEPTMGGGLGQVLVGVIADLQLNEVHKDPYMKDYTLKFVGRFKSSDQTAKGARGQKNDQKRVSTVMASIGKRAAQLVLPQSATGRFGL